MINKSEVLTLCITTKCNIKCSCCIQDYSATTMTAESVYNIINTIHSLKNIQRINITGGEPFLEYELIKKIVLFTNKINIKTSIITNASWCLSYKLTNEKIQFLKNNGLDFIVISYDAYHAQFVEIDKIITLLDVLKENTINTKIYSIISDRYEEITEKLIKKIVNYRNVKIERRWLIPLGYAKEEPITYHSNFLKENDFSSCYQNIGTIYPDGSFFPCCSAGAHPNLNLGNIFKEPISEILKKNEKLEYINILANEGPIGLLYRLPEHYYRRYKRKKYTSSCHLCYELFNDDFTFRFLKERLRKLDVAEQILLSAHIRK